ncbi:DNA topoisomerase IB, partial [Pseudanabaenaceae cyanobacterium LEGE 13415]|nr:DNA topoisomerase IB [Pseudanabaenaceae cyanobacterium LEGE 13415]
INSSDVNDYLREITGQEFTAKDFRTWAGTVLAASHLAEIGKFTSQTAAKKNVTQVIKTVSSYLGNRPATCKKYYIHPNVLEAYLDESLHDLVEKHSSIVIDDRYALRVEELIVVALLTETAIDRN